MELNAKECGQRAVFERAAIGFGSGRDVVDDVLTTTIDVVRRAGDERLAITDVAGTLLFSLRPQGALATLEPGTAAGAVGSHRRGPPLRRPRRVTEPAVVPLPRVGVDRRR